MGELSLAQEIAIWALPVLFAITVHEVAHGWMARLLGDPTAMMLGRLSLNPVKHIDPTGTILVPGLMLLLSKLFGGGLFLFGWARPVPITWQNLRQPKRDMALVAAAGPAANLLMGVGWALIARAGVALAPGMSWIGTPILYMGIAGIYINTLLMVLNLLPLPPLDGGRVLTGLLPGRLALRYARIEPYGLLILVLLLVSGKLGFILEPVISFVVSGLGNIAGLPAGVL